MFMQIPLNGSGSKVCPLPSRRVAPNRNIVGPPWLKLCSGDADTTSLSEWRQQKGDKVRMGSGEVPKRFDSQS